MNRRSITPTDQLQSLETNDINSTDSIASIEINHIIEKTNYNYIFVLLAIILIVIKYFLL